ncbi:hypothetical protein PV327_011505 [Microctonus hyperodae]|uniref:Secreted protein n=1 Tax=Microctonus hyperodae TaxID=165561 RepID=A0AA39KPX9_MICHY|nr:hypothetical protein PV327_011505 [Microctonus hyperodae]
MIFKLFCVALFGVVFFQSTTSLSTVPMTTAHQNDETIVKKHKFDECQFKRQELIQVINDIDFVFSLLRDYYIQALIDEIIVACREETIKLKKN